MFLIVTNKGIFTSNHTEIIRWDASEKVGGHLCFGEYYVDNKQFVINYEPIATTDFPFIQKNDQPMNLLKTSNGFFNKMYSEFKKFFFRK